MALIPCPECSNQVSTQAWSCPKCGAPIAARNAPPVVAPPDDKRPVTVEQTSKSIKLGILLCSVAFWIGLITAFSADTPQQSQGATFLLVIGAIGYIALKIARWWVNG